MPKKIIINKTGDPSVLEFVDFALADKGPEKEEVRIKHNSVGVNFIDTYHRSGLYPIELPSSLGLEAVGEIVDVGADVRQLAIGDRVGYSSPPLGAYSEIRDLHAKNVFKIPTNLSDDEAASILLKGMTVEYLFNRTYKIRPGETILFHAAAGGVGLIACQWARAVGCNLIGTVGSDEKMVVSMLLIITKKML